MIVARPSPPGGRRGARTGPAHIVIRAVGAGLRNASLSQHDLAAGSSRVDGTSAVSILTGTLCSSHSAKPVTQSPLDCITNSDPHSDNPVFRVAMELGADRRWQVVYRVPPTAGAGNPTP